MQLILASKSPRRHDILKWMGIPFAAEACPDPETINRKLSPSDLVKELALHKAQYAQAIHKNDYILGADTIVVIDSVILGKPLTEIHAKEYLRMIQGRTHIVYTGVALLHNDYKDVRACSTEVTFRTMSDSEIDWYISTGDPLDKAGAYGIQGLGSAFVESIRGNYFNVIGLPAPVVYDMFLKSGFINEKREMCHESVTRG